MIHIKKNGIVTNIGPDQAWLDAHIAMGTFGSPALYQDVQVLVSPEVRGEVQVLQSPATFNEFGEELTPATYSINPDGLIEAAVYRTETQLVSPAEYEIEIIDNSAELEAQAIQSAKIQAGKDAREACQMVLDLIAGYNLDRELSMAEISQLQSLMSSPEAALRAGRPTLAKQFITAVAPDGVLVTEEMKQAALSLLSNY